MPAPLTTHVADGLDAPVRLLSLRLWAGFAALALVVAATIVWSLVATLPQHVSASGVIVHGTGAVSVGAPAAGSLTSVAVTPGARVHRGQLLGTLAAGRRSLGVRAPIDGTVMSILAAPGRELLPGAPVVAIDPAAQPAAVVLFVSSPQDLARIVPGQRVDLAGATGRIRAVTPYSASAADLLTRFATTRIPGAGGGHASTWLVDVSLDPSSAPVLPALAPVEARVLVDHVRPYELVFGGSR